MSEPNFNENDCTIGLSESGTHAVITVPIKRYAMDHTNGNKLIFGCMREIEFHLISMADQLRLRSKANGILRVEGMGLPPNSKEN